MVEQYQSFEYTAGASNSLAKLRALGLPPLKDRSFLDVGCNEGFFCEFARRAGASVVLGIDANPEFIARACARFPLSEFRCQSWDQEIEGCYDVILLASALHYADDQISVLRRLLEHLTPTGVFVLESGIIDSPSPELTLVERPVGDARYFPSIALFERKLPEYIVRVIGDSVTQAGDSVRRKVLHIVKRNPILLVMDQPSYSGKSAACAALVRADNKGVALVSVDELLDRLKRDNLSYEADAELVVLLKSYLETQSKLAGDVIEFVCKSGFAGRFVQFALAVYGASGKSVIWDGYIPQSLKPLFYEQFEAQGYVVWRTEPHRTRSFAATAIDDVIFADRVFRGFRSGRPVKFHLDMVTSEAHTVRLLGWSLDIEGGCPLSKFRVCIGDVPVEITDITATQRPDASSLLKTSSEHSLGFAITVKEADIVKAMSGMTLSDTIAWASSPQSTTRLLRLFGYDSEGGVVEAEYSSSRGRRG